MDIEQVAHVENVLQLFENRMSHYDKTTEAILEELKPLLTEFCNICQTTFDETTWIKVELNMPLVTLACSIYYEDPDRVPDFMNVLSPVDVDSSDADYCFRRMGFALPLVIAFKDPDEIRDFIQETIDKALVKRRGAESPPLTVEQQTLAFLHRDTSKGQKH